MSQPKLYERKEESGHYTNRLSREERSGAEVGNFKEIVEPASTGGGGGNSNAKVLENGRNLLGEDFRSYFEANNKRLLRPASASAGAKSAEAGGENPHRKYSTTIKNEKARIVHMLDDVALAPKWLATLHQAELEDNEQRNNFLNKLSDVLNGIHHGYPSDSLPRFVIKH